MKLNEKIGTGENTYYFTTGFHDTNHSKSKDLMKIPAKITKMALGFDIDSEKSIVFDTKRTKQYKNNAAKTIWGDFFINIFSSSNIVETLHSHNFHSSLRPSATLMPSSRTSAPF
jgi:hypothetical protein